MGLLYVIITAVLFATLEPVSKVVAPNISPLAISGIRFLIGGLMLLPVSIREMRKKKIHLNFVDHMKMVGLGILFICISMVMLQYAIKLSPDPALIAIVFSANSVMTICLSAFLLKEKIDWKKIVALLLCIGGILVCSWDSLYKGSEAFPIVLAVLAAITFSIYAVLNKKMMKKASGNILISYSFLYGSIAILLVNWIIGQPFLTLKTGNSLGMQDIFIMAYLGFAVTGIGYWSYFKAMEKGSATLASLSFFVKPALSPIVAIVVKEVFPDMESVAPTVQTFIALGMVLIGSYLVSYADRKK